MSNELVFVLVFFSLVSVLLAGQDDADCKEKVIALYKGYYNKMTEELRNYGRLLDNYFPETSQLFDYKEITSGNFAEKFAVVNAERHEECEAIMNDYNEDTIKDVSGCFPDEWNWQWFEKLGQMIGSDEEAVTAYKALTLCDAKDDLEVLFL